MKKLLVTGGTVFVSKFTAKYFSAHGYEVYVLNRNTREQVRGVTLIEADRHALGDRLKKYGFDAVVDVTAYNGGDIAALTDALGKFGTYIMISSSAVYPETAAQPFTEETETGENKFWGAYGTGKIEAEKELLKRVPDAYILRPPYLYGEMNNVYRESFVFDCAVSGRKFYLPREGEMKLQFFDVSDLCRFIEIILNEKPKEHIFNVGNSESVTVKEWVEMCYACAGKDPDYVNVTDGTEQRSYFSFYDYEYALDVSKQQKLMPETVPLTEGLKKAYEWYKENEGEVRKKPFIKYIDGNMK